MMKKLLFILTTTGKFSFFSSSNYNRKFVFVLLTTLSIIGIGSPTFAQNISTSIISGGPVCAGSSVSLTFDVTNGASDFTTSTNYLIYMSDTTGGNYTLLTSFTSATAPASGSGESATITKSITIPTSTLYGTGYKIAVGSTSPTFDGSNGSLDFTINAKVVPTVSITSSTGNSICAGDSVTFTATNTNGGSSPTFQWKLNGTNTGGNNPTYSSTTLVNTDKITVVLTSNADCAIPTSVTSNQITMTVNDVLVPDVSISASSTTICPGNNVTFSTTTINGGTNPNYQWKVNGVNAGTNSPTFSSSTLADGDTVTVELTSNAICSLPTTDTSNSISITVRPATPATPLAISGTVTQCPALTNQNYSIATVANASSYNWIVPTGWTITSGTGTNAITVTTGNSGQNGNITVSATNSCGTSATSILAVTVSPGTPATPGAITGTTAQCPALTSQSYSITAVTNATSYNWAVPSGWTITSGGGSNAITVSTGSAGQNGDITVNATNTCGTSSNRSLAVTVSPATPATPGSITGTATQCPALTSQSYSVLAVTNATSYNWIVPTGWAITSGSGTNAITVTTGNAGQNGNISVSATNSCGTSAINTYAVTVSPGTPATPGTITGTTAQCPALTSQSYSITAVTNATSYNWAVPTGWTITSGFGTNAITVTTGSAGQNGNLTVNATNTCGTSSNRSLAVTVNPGTPATPGTITGTATQCPALTSQSYSILAVTNATSYNWIVPTGWTITAGSGTNTITVTTGNTGQNGNISVSATNSCGASSINTFTVTVSPGTPATPGSITGTATQCPALTSQSYNITAVTNATSYNWAVPSGWTITSGGGSNAITVTTGSAGQNGNITVNATNTCGTSSNRSLAVTVSPGTPATPSTISGSKEQCISKIGLSYSISSVLNASSYTWTLPSGWNITSGTNTNTITVSTSGTAVSGTIMVTANNSCGTSSAQTLAIIVNTGLPATPPAPSQAVGQANSICPVATGLIYSIPTVANATNYIWNVPTGWIITSGQGTTSIIATAGVQSTGSKNISVTATNACGSTTSPNLGVTVGTFAYIDAGTDQIVCIGTSSVTLDATAAGATNINNDLTWSAPSGSFSNNGKYNATYTIDNTIKNNGGTVILTATVRAEGSCGTASDQISIIVLPNPTASINVTGTNPICNGSSSTVTFNATPNSTVVYKINNGSNQNITVNGSGTTTLNTGVLNANTTYSLVSVNYSTAPSCSQTVTGTATVNVNAASTVNAGADQTICQSATPSAITLSGASFGGGATSAAWAITSGGGALSSTAQTGSPETVTYTPDANYSGNVILTLITNSLTSCSPVSATRTITVNPASTVNAGTDQTICQSATPSAIILSDASFGGGATSAAWAITSGGGTLSSTLQTASPATVTYTPAANYSGPVILTLTTNSLTSCATISATRTITINTASTVNAGADQTICQSATPSAITLSGASFGGGATTAAWAISSGGGTLSSTLQTASPATVTYTPAVNYSGTVILTLTTNSLTSCATISATRTITINAASTVNAGADQTICQSATPSAITLSGASFGGGATSAAWAITSGGGTLSSTLQTASPATVTYTPAANYSGNVVLTLTTNSLTSCATISATRTISINAASTVNAGADQTICQSTTPSAITLSGATFGGGATSAAWVITSGGGTLSSTLQTGSPATVTYTPAANYSGNVILTLTTNSLTSCTLNSATRTITINAASTVNAGADQTICQSATPSAITLSGASFGGGATSAAWAITSGGGTLSSTLQTASPATVTYTPAANYSGNVVLTLTTNSLTSCATISATRTITVNAASTVNAGADQTICQSATPSAITMSGASFGGGATSVAWAITSGGGTLSSTLQTAFPATVTYTPAANYSGTVILTLTTNSLTSCVTASAIRTFTIKKEVIITTQPSNTSICASLATDLNVVAIGDGLAYQWYKVGIPTDSVVVNSTNISGAQLSNLHFNQVNLTDDGAYYVKVSGTSPCSTKTSATRTLNVDQDIIVTTEPISQSICTGSNVTFTVVADANGDPLTFQWRKNGAIISGLITSDSSSSSLTINGIVAGDAANYDVLISGPSGYTCSSAQSASALLTVNPYPTISGGLNVCTGFTTQLNGSTSAAAINPWVSSNTTIATISNSGLVSAVTPGTSVITYTNSNGCQVTATITVTQTAQVVQPTSQVICNGNPTNLITFETLNSGGTTTYSWTNTSSSIGLAATGTGDISSFTAINTGNSPIIATIVVTPNYNNGSANCDGPTKTFTLTVKPTPNAVSTPASQTICSEGSITTMVMSGNVASTTYNWTRNNTASVTGIATSGTGNISGSLTNTTFAPVTVTFTITPTVNGCSGTPMTATVLVNPTPNASATNASQTICSGATIATMVITGSVTTSTYNWTRNNTVSVTGIAASGSGNISGDLTNTTSVPVTVTFTITPTANGCSGTPINTTIIVNPTPNAVATPASQTICTVGSISTIVLSGTVTSTTYNWTRNNTVSITGIPASGSGNISGSLNNTTSAPITVTFTITPTANGCTGSSITSTVLVNPDATISLTSVAGTNNQTKCINTAITTITYAIAGGTGASITAGGFPTGVTGSFNAGVFTINGTPSVSGTFPYTVTTSGPCINAALSGTITVDPISVGGSLTGYATDQSGNPYNNPIIYSKNLIACESTDGLLLLQGAIGSIIRWEYSTDAGINWTVLGVPSPDPNKLPYSNIPHTRIYRAVIQSGSCGIAYSNIVTVSVVPQDIKPSPVTVSKSTMCLGETTVFTAVSGFATGLTITGGDFNQGQLNTQDPDGWLVNGDPGGWTANGDNTKPSIDWSGTNGPKTFGGITYDTSDNSKFGIVYGIVTSKLETPIFNTFGLTTAKLEFHQAYFLDAGSNIKVELSTNGGISYPISLQNITGSVSSGGFIGLNHTIIDLSDYVGQSKLRIRFVFTGVTANSTWALENFKLPTPPASPDIVWTDENQNIIGTTTTHSETPGSPGLYNFAVTSFLNGCVYTLSPSNTVYIPVKVNLAYAGKDVAILAADCGNNSVALNAYDNRETADKNIADGAFDNNYQPSTHPGTGATGKWTIKSTTSTCGTGTFSPNDTDPKATFSGVAGTYVLTWTTGGCSDDVQIIFRDCKDINFDGINDNITFKDNYNLTDSFSIEVWVKPNLVTGIQTILSKRNSNNLVNGYDLKLDDKIVSFNWNTGGKVQSNYSISTSRWYHIAVTFDTGVSLDSGGVYRLYIDGIEVSNPQGVPGDKPIDNNFDCILGAMNQTNNPPNKPVKYFNGWMDELRIWNTPLTPEQLHQMMNQEIKPSPTVAGNVQGKIVPIDVNGITWTSNLLGYYQMSDISCGYLNPTKGTALGKLRNITTAEEQTAPIPYISANNGDWKTMNTWVQPLVWDYPNSTGYNGTPIDWNIVRTGHDIISSTQDVKLLGLLVDTNKLTITSAGIQNENNNGNGLFLSHYLLINGNIDLVGESQLVEKRYTPTQFSESILDVSSTGFIKRDQQGKKNSYNYNYWSSPVSTIQGSVNNAPYTISTVLKDGTISASPKTIDFGDGAYFADTPNVGSIKITNRWIWSYNAPIVQGDDWGNYFKWYNITSGGTLKVGEGYIMKGTGGAAAITDTQNYAFIGKPNSGAITLTMIKGNSYLVGNPYPSALDADEFIKDNIKETINSKVGRNTKNIFSGALYFWDHFGLSNNHILAQYEGGYAAYSLMGGAPGIAKSPLTATGAVNSTNKEPGRYIPVGQGFFIDGYLDIGTPKPGVTSVVDGDNLDLIFKNSQRAFIREGSASSVFMKTKESTKTNNTDIRPRIRLGFDSSIGEHRQLLVGADINATNLFDIGYDAPMYGKNANDMYWEILNSNFVIQAVPDFNTNQTIPIGIIVEDEGEIKIKIDELENVPSNINIYLFDQTTGLFHDLRKSDFKIDLTKGEYNKRFSLKFEDQTLDVLENDPNDGILVFYSRNFKKLIIKNNDINSTVNTVFLYSMEGKAINKWKVENKNQPNIQIPIKNISAEIYIVKVSTSKGDISKKIIIN